MDYGLKGKVALVTGAASGIGRATAELFARDGARVVASDVSAEAGAAVVAGLTAGGADARFVAADVTDRDALAAAVADAVAAFGRLDCAANCAGVGGGHASTHEYPEAEFDRIVEINLRGTWLAMRAEIDAMLKSGGGAIVNVASTLGLRGSPFAAPYSASKHAVLGLTRTAALEYALQGIRVNAVCPAAGNIEMVVEALPPGFDLAARRTDQGAAGSSHSSPLGRRGRMEDVADAVVFLASDESAFISGADLMVDGAMSAGMIIPGQPGT
jgi:NAD(P)-dependent dehydrogenase (short-subunit alcohol dehydrogenase family)